MGQDVKANVVSGNTVITRAHAGHPVAEAENDLTIRVVEESDILAMVNR